jgi:histidinol dehydrogenase
MTIELTIINATDPALERFMERNNGKHEEITTQVAGILAAVKAEGDRAVCEFINRFSGVELSSDELKVTEEEKEKAYQLVEKDFIAAVRLALDNITNFHRRQLQHAWFEPGEQGIILGQLVRPLRRVGIYVPGGKATYPSSVLMNAVPAKVAGVKEICMVSPPNNEQTINPYTLVAAAEAGVEEIYKMGGAQAIAALAYGTATVPKVDKITGPGNIFVTLAKQQVYGQVDIDMLAGPSEVLIIADDTANPVFVAADLLAQAEHDELSAAVLLTPSANLAHNVQGEVARQTASLPRQEIIQNSLKNHGVIVITEDLGQAFSLANRFAPEHLELMISDPYQELFRVENAGAVFLGHYSPEPVGDYLAGPNHVLPTGGTARFYSPLGVETFMKKTSLIAYTQSALDKTGGAIVKLAEVEGLNAHANAVRLRIHN